MSSESQQPLSTKSSGADGAACAESLGALAALPGRWAGTGFSLIARPDHSGTAPNGIFLQLNLLRETLEFVSIGAPVMNRGSAQGDIAIEGLTYLHRVTDLPTSATLHVENGMWLNIPATQDPKSGPSIARLGTIPHGNAMCTVGFSQVAEFDRLPGIPPANTIPFAVGAKPPATGIENPYAEFDLSKPNANRSNSLPAEITQVLVNDPNQLLRDTLSNQVERQGMVLKSIVRLITMTGAEGVANIPFITRNANAPSVESVFAIETVKRPDGGQFLQLQYSQTVLINFGGKSYPHVTVGTLTKCEP